MMKYLFIQGKQTENLYKRKWNIQNSVHGRTWEWSQPIIGSWQPWSKPWEVPRRKLSKVRPDVGPVKIVRDGKVRRPSISQLCSCIIKIYVHFVMCDRIWKFSNRVLYVECCRILLVNFHVGCNFVWDRKTNFRNYRNSILFKFSVHE